MSSPRVWQWAAALPVLGFLLAYASLGRLDPAYWLGEPPSGIAVAQTWRAKPARSATPRSERRSAAPWPDEPAMRLQLAGRGLRLTGFQLGSQRMGVTEVRVTLQWQGALGPSLEMLQALALDMPQMALDALVLQSVSPTEWRVIWRGQWQQTTAPDPLPPRPRPMEGLLALGRDRPFDPGLLRRELARLWPHGQPSAAVLRLVRPEDLQWVAVVLRPQAVAWLSWQQHTLVVRVGDRIGDAGAWVQAIGAEEVVIAHAGRTHRLHPALSDAPHGRAP